MEARQSLGREKTISEEIEDRTGVRSSKCYQCGKCTAGCPMVPDMDYTPSQIMRLIQVNDREAALGAKAVWFCASCLTCSTRCPQEVEIAAVMDALRELSLREGKAHRDAKKVLAFSKAFLRSVETKGRLFEMGMVMGYKLRSRDFLADMAIAPWLFLKRKLRLRPSRVRGLEELRRLFDRTRPDE